MFTYIAKRHIERGGRVLVFTHRKELLNQAGGAFEKFGLEPELITAGSSPDLTKSLHVSMIETFDRRKNDYEIFLSTRTLVIIDEAHLNTFTKLFKSFPLNIVVIGATATPYRKGKTIPPLSELYNDIVQEVDTLELIDSGFLSKAKTYGVKIDLSSAKKKGEDYDVSDYYEENKMWHGVIENWKRLTPNTKTILFSSNVESSKKVCDEFVLNGYDAKHIDGKTPKKEREIILKWYSEPGPKIICNCGILNAGFDQPDIKTVILYRATTSLPLFLQMCGRGSRTTSEKNSFNILDFGNNVSRLGFWEKERIWSLENDNKRSNKEGEAPIKECPECFALVAVSKMKCDFCDHVFEKTEKDKEEEKITELQILNYTQIKDLLKTADFDTIENIAKARGYKNGWIYHQIKTIEDLERYAKYKGYSMKWVDYQINLRKE